MNEIQKVDKDFTWSVTTKNSWTTLWPTATMRADSLENLEWSMWLGSFVGLLATPLGAFWSMPMLVCFAVVLFGMPFVAGSSMMLWRYKLNRSVPRDVTTRYSSKVVETMFSNLPSTMNDDPLQWVVGLNRLTKQGEPLLAYANNEDSAWLTNLLVDSDFRDDAMDIIKTLTLTNNPETIATAQKAMDELRQARHNKMTIDQPDLSRDIKAVTQRNIFVRREIASPEATPVQA